MSDNINVVVKVRPLIQREIDEKLPYLWRINENTLQLTEYSGHCYSFDKVYDEQTHTSVVYDDIAKPIVEAAVKGINGTIFAYGQTSSGKTYTMTGTDENPGITQLAVYGLFDIIKSIPDRDFLLRVSYIEIYNETLKDLFNVTSSKLKINDVQGIDATEKVTTTPEEVLLFMKEGEANRRIGATNMNEQSSRSHTIFQITIESREHRSREDGEGESGEVNVSQLNLVDLAGSERAGQTGSTGIRFREGTHINKSLSTLGLVIKQLSEDNKHVNYRDSKLTRILQNSLGGNAKTSIICAVTPASLEETISTLQFASRAKAVKNKPEVNVVLTKESMIESLTKELAKLRTKLETKANVEVNNKYLKLQIESLQRKILNSSTVVTSLRSGNRRKTWCVEPRRATISCLPSIDEDDKDIPKFSTPAYKYNPLTVLQADLFQPIKEENTPNNRNVVTPPNEQRVTFKDDVIELDSDGEEVLPEPQICSPYHKCRNNIQTPPCVLKEKALKAERDYKNIIELTQREKMYQPDIVELLEKIDKKAVLIDKLKEELGDLSHKCSEQDSKLAKVNNEIDIRDANIKELTLEKEKLSKEWEKSETKCAELEFSYKALEAKLKVKEDELKSLMKVKCEERGAINKNKDEAKTNDFKVTNFMDMSTDISLVNSDNENSILGHEAHHYLEQQLSSQKELIVNLRNENHSIQSKYNCTTEKLIITEEENILLKDTVKTLSSSIKNQKDYIDNINIDIDSYKNVIHELQLKLSQKENKVDLHNIESMFAIEDKLISNNENIKNLVTGFKNFIINTELKPKNQDIVSDYKKMLEDNEKRIHTLEKELMNLQTKTNNYMQQIQRLSEENNTLINKEKSLSNLLFVAEETKNKLENELKDGIAMRDNQIQTLIQDQETLKNNVTERDMQEKEISNRNNDLLLQISQLNTVIDNHINDINAKDSIILSLTRNSNSERYSNMHNVNSKIYEILSNLTGVATNNKHLNSSIDNIATEIDDNLTSLECVVTDVLSEKNDAVQNVSSLQKELTLSLERYEKDCALLHSQINDYKQSSEQLETFNNTLKQQHIDLNTQLINVKQNLENKSKENQEQKMKLLDIVEINDKLKDYIKEKEENITLHVQKEAMLKLEIETLYTSIEKEFDNIKININRFNDEIDSKKDVLYRQIENKEKHIEKLACNLEIVKKKHQDMFTEMNKVKEDLAINESLLANILREIKGLLDIMINNVGIDLETIVDKYEIPIAIIKIADHIRYINKDYASEGEIKDKMNKLEEELIELKEKFINALQNIRILEEENQNLKIKISTNSDIVNNTQEEINDLKIINNKLEKNCTISDNRYFIARNIIEKLKVENNDLNNNIKEINVVVESLKNDINLKTEEIVSLKNEISELITDLDHLKQDNHHVKEYCDELKKSLNSLKDNAPINNFTLDSYENATIVPHKLKNICLKNIIDIMYTEAQNKNGSETASSSNTDIECSNLAIQVGQVKNINLPNNIEKIEKENLHLKSQVTELTFCNKNLNSALEETKLEVKSLSDLAFDLHKTIRNHRTSLLTLTATNFAENNLLKCQVKTLQHHQNRYRSVCERDIPEMKNELIQLYGMLRNENCGGNSSTISTVLDSSFKRYSLPTILDRNSNLSILKNDPNVTFGSDLLMLDTNVTLNTTSDNTLIEGNNDAECPIIDVTVVEDNSKKYDTLVTNETLKNNVILMDEPCTNCRHLNEIILGKSKEIDVIKDQFCDTINQKEDIENKYRDISMELQTTQSKLKTLQVDCNSKSTEIANLKTTLSKKSNDLKRLQDENDTLSNDLMDNISEVDDLKKEIDLLKVEINKRNTDVEATQCPQCLDKDQLLEVLRQKHVDRDINQSINNSFRHDKYYTLQQEIYESREDCKKITEEVATIKTRIEQNNLSITQPLGLGQHLNNPDVFITTEKVNEDNFTSEAKLNDNLSELYSMDKNECLHYFLQVTGHEMEMLDRNSRIIELMKLLHNKLVYEHASEIENLNNKLINFDVLKREYQTQIDDIKIKYDVLCKELANKEAIITEFSKVIEDIKNNTDIMKESLITCKTDEYVILIKHFQENILKHFDKHFALPVTSLFDALIGKLSSKQHQDLNAAMSEYKHLENKISDLMVELTTVNESLLQMKEQLTVKENEYNVLQAEKAKVHEISSAVTLDIIRTDQKYKDIVNKGIQSLIEHDILCSNDIDLDQNVTEIMNALFKLVITKVSTIKIDFTTNSELTTTLQKERDALHQQIKYTQTDLQEKNQQLSVLKTQLEKYEDINRTLTSDIVEKENALANHSSIHKTDTNKINELSSEILTLKDMLVKNTEEVVNLKLQIQHDNERSETINRETLNEFVEKVSTLEKENNCLKEMNNIVLKERDQYNLELEKVGKLLKQKEDDLNKMEIDLKGVNESFNNKLNDIKELKTSFEKLLLEHNKVKAEFDLLTNETSQLKNMLKSKYDECSRYQLDIKTIEKSAEIQCKMIKRLQKEADDQIEIINEKNKVIGELTEKLTSLQSAYNITTQNVKDTQDVITKLKDIKFTLETRVSELEQVKKVAGNGSGQCRVDRKERRQSFYDSNRTISAGSQEYIETDDSMEVEAVFSSSISKRTSDQLSSRDNSPHQKQSPARLSVDLASGTRRRRQSAHDLSRCFGHGDDQTPSRTVPKSADGSTNSSLESEVERLRAALRELDRECEECAERLHSRDERCNQLYSEKMALEDKVAELTEKLSVSSSTSGSLTKANVAVNTDEGVFNLTCVFVDRMSFDAEVNKNKKLTKALEEFHHKNRSLKAALEKSQRIIEHQTNARKELEELKQRYKQLDEECEICAAKLNERDEQCYKLSAEKKLLEQKLSELVNDTSRVERAALEAEVVRSKKLKDRLCQYELKITNLKATINKLQDVIATDTKKLESTLTQLDKAKEESRELRERCDRLTNAKLLLESKLSENHVSSDLIMSSRKKRHSLHDQNREHNVTLVDVATSTTPDDDKNHIESSRSYLQPLQAVEEARLQEIQSLKLRVETLSREKSMLERRTPHTMFVSTGSGIVQDQQITDIMKENQKLKRINSKLVNLCKKRDKNVTAADRENETPPED